MSSVVTIGNFDGVHRGHTALVQRARRVADAHAAPQRPAVIALVLDPHPATVLRPGQAPARLTTFEQRAGLLRAAGADTVKRLEPTPRLLGLSAQEFIAEVVRDWSPVAIVEGADFRFGRGRAGDIALLRTLAGAAGFSVEVVEPITAVLSDHTEVIASSTMVRWLVDHGRARDAAAVLGRAYSVVGRVVPGDRRGRTLGYPTANIETPCLIPADGVYAGRAILGDGRAFAAAASVGTKPQFDGRGRTLEAYLMLAEGGGGAAPASAGGRPWTPIAGLPEYGWGIELEFIAWLRDQARFESVEGLLSQIERDCAKVQELVSRRGACEEVSA